MSIFQIFGRLLLSCILGGLIGLEREYIHKPAGLRTHVLVCLGSTLFTLLSLYAFPSSNSDPSRIAAQIVTGIGFLGAGTILRSGFNVLGLTTAATLWSVAAVGLACGCGYYDGALLTTFLILFFLISLKPIEEILESRKSKEP